jgi:hypothetical protein
MRRTLVVSLALLVFLAAVGCTPSTTHTVKSTPATPMVSLLPSATPLPTKQAVKKFVRWATRGSHLPASTTIGTPIALYRSASKSTVATASLAFTAKPYAYLVSLDTSSGPRAEFWMAPDLAERYANPPPMEEEAHNLSDEFRKGMREVIAALGSGSRAIAFTGVYDGVYGEKSDQVAIVFTNIPSGGMLSNGDATGTRLVTPSVVEFHVYLGAEARSLVEWALTAK